MRYEQRIARLQIKAFRAERNLKAATSLRRANYWFRVYDKLAVRISELKHLANS